LLLKNKVQEFYNKKLVGGPNQFDQKSENKKQHFVHFYVKRFGVETHTMITNFYIQNFFVNKIY